MAKPLHIVIAEPSAIIRYGLVSLLQQSTSLSADIVELNDITTLSTTTFRVTPDLLIINPLHLGIYLPSQLKVEMGNENLKIVALHSVLTDPNTIKSYDASFSIYDGVGSIVDTLLEVTRGNQEQEGRKELSQREKEIIVCVVKGMTNKQIADSLCLSTHTVIAHRRNIAGKLQIHSPSGLTIYAIVNKLIDLADVKNSISQSRDEE
ncbi:MAG: LuxR C-terminal-related transcriptional regulator [Rikenellaceae bacterium]